MGALINGVKQDMPLRKGVPYNALIDGEKVWGTPVQQFRFTINTQYAADKLTFAIPTSSWITTQATVKPYAWTIDWGDGTAESVTGNSASDSAGIPHTYAASKTYKIRITPADPAQLAWFRAFGFSSATTGCNTQANKNCMISLDSPLAWQMTRTALSTTIAYEYAYMFYKCVNITMGPRFNLPQNIVSIHNFVGAYMFAGCNGANFNMNSIFNFPQGISNGGYSFWNMFNGCSGAAFTMNAILNFPPNQNWAGANGNCSSVFTGCSGAAFTMNEVFQIPQNGTYVGGAETFSNLFYGCTNLTLNPIFNFPDMTTLNGSTGGGGKFSKTFYGCNATKLFARNNVLKLPTINDTDLASVNIFTQTFAGMTGTSPRTAASIIGSMGEPPDDRNTFGTAFPDYSQIPANWRQ
jgi:hypothetical protein